MELPPSTSTRSNLTLLMHGSRIRRKRPGSGMAAHWSCLLKEISLCDQGEFWISNQAIGAVHVKAGSLQELSFSFGFDGNFASKDGVYHIAGTDVLVSWVPILVVVFLTVPILLHVFLDGIPLSGPLCVDAFEDTAFFNRVVGFGMELARSFQPLVIVFLVVSPSIRTLDCVHLVVVVTRPLASEIVTVVATPIPPFSVVAVVAAARISVVEASMTVVLSGRLVGSSHVFSDEFFCVVGVAIILGCGEELGDYGRPFA